MNNTSQNEATVQIPLEPGERLIWSEVGGTRWNNRDALRKLLPLVMGMLIFLTFTGLSFWQFQQHVEASHREFLSHVPPQSRAFFEHQSSPSNWFMILPFFFVGSFCCLFGGIVFWTTRMSNRNVRYAVTNLRLIVARGGVFGTGSQITSFTPAEIAFVKTRRHPDGTGDVLFAFDASSDAAVGVNGIPINLPMRPEIGFIGVRDPEYVERLLNDLVTRSAGASAASTYDIASANTVSSSRFSGSTAEQAGARMKAIAPGQGSHPLMETDPSTRSPHYPAAGVVFALIGAFFLWCNTYGMGVPYHSLTDFLNAGAAIGILFLVGGYRMALRRRDLILDETSRTYRYRRGLMPYAKWQEGSFDDIDHLDVTRRFRSVPEGRDTNRITPFWFITLYWRAPKRPPFCIEGSDAKAPIRYPDRFTALIACRALAARLGVPVKEEASALPARRSLVKANLLWLLLIPLFLNSYFGLIVWDENWSDTAGNVYQKENTIFRTDTVAISPDGQRHYARCDYMPFSSSTQTLGLQQTGERRDYHGGFRLGRIAPASIWPTPLPGSPAAEILQVASLHHSADVCRATKQWRAAADVYTQLIALQEHSPLIASQPQSSDRIAEDLNRLVRLRLMAGDLVGYRQACADQLRRYGNGSNLWVINNSIWNFALAPDATSDYTPLLRQIAEVVRRERAYAYLNTQGLLLCRAGRYSEAIQAITAGLKVNGKARPADQLALGLAHLRLGHRTEAQRYLALACGQFESDMALSASTSSGALDSWPDALENEILSREAHDLLKAVTTRSHEF